MPVLKNAKHERFAQEVAKGASAAAAYTLAGYKQDNADAVRACASRLLTNANIAARVEELKAAGAEEAGVTIARVLQELARIGFSDLRKAVEWRGNLVTIEEDAGEDADGRVVVKQITNNQIRLVDSAAIDDDTAAAIAEVSQTATGALRIKLHDKKGALELIGKHLGMFKDRVEVTGKDGAPVEINDSARAKALAAFVAKTKYGKPD